MLEKFRKALRNWATKVYIDITGSPLKQVAPQGEAASDPAMSELLCRAAAEGAVLLENDGTLPLKDKFALFGRTQADSFYTGYGSGGDVIKPYQVSIAEGILKERGLAPDAELLEAYRKWAKEHPVDHGYWGNWPLNYPEMPLTEDFVKGVAARAETAVVVLGRAAGEDRDCLLQEGSYYLKAEERNMLALAKKYFKKLVVLLNIGNIIDFSWVDEFSPNAVLLLWQGGMETGNACAKLLSGEVSPSGKLSMTIAKRYEDYPASNFGDASHTSTSATAISKRSQRRRCAIPSATG